MFCPCYESHPILMVRFSCIVSSQATRRAGYRIEVLGMMNLEPLWNLKLFIESVAGFGRFMVVITWSECHQGIKGMVNQESKKVWLSGAT